jgi:succinyl-CoA synthetase alpha subunit
VGGGGVSQTVEVRPGAYHDSVTLLQVSRAAGQVEGVQAALVAMATELNLELLAAMELEAPAGVTSNDLLIALRAVDDDALAAAVAAVEAALVDKSRPAAAGFGDAPVARTVGGAARTAEADLALISVPGEHAFVEAMDALAAGLHVMVFSDNVPVAQEVALKAEGARRGLLVMGPDAGTAVVGGVGLGFSNAVAPGPVGIVAASGTGTQQLCCLLDDAGVGISHALGVGGRDLSEQVGAAATLAGLDMLDADEATELIVVLSKPPAPSVADQVRARAKALSTPVVLGLLGPGEADLTAVAADALRALGREPAAPGWWPAPAERTGAYPRIAGLFAGGTLCEEAELVVAEARAEGVWTFTDYGDDRYTRGRPHPMIDNTLRLEALDAEIAAGPGVVLLDVVLGYGAHPDPAAELAPAIARAVEAGLAVVVSLCGTGGDPQGRDRQAQALVDAGASVHLSNADAARTAAELAA